MNQLQFLFCDGVRTARFHRHLIGLLKQRPGGFQHLGEQIFIQHRGRAAAKVDGACCQPLILHEGDGAGNFLFQGLHIVRQQAALAGHRADEAAIAAAAGTKGDADVAGDLLVTQLGQALLHPDDVLEQADFGIGDLKSVLDEACRLIQRQPLPHGVQHQSGRADAGEGAPGRLLASGLRQRVKQHGFQLPLVQAPHQQGIAGDGGFIPACDVQRAGQFRLAATNAIFFRLRYYNAQISALQAAIPAVHLGDEDVNDVKQFFVKARHGREQPDLHLITLPGPWPG